MVHHAVQQNVRVSAKPCAKDDLKQRQFLPTEVIGQPIPLGKGPTHHEQNHDRDDGERCAKVSMQKGVNRMPVIYQVVERLDIDEHIRRTERQEADVAGRNGMYRCTWPEMKWGEGHVSRG